MPSMVIDPSFRQMLASSSDVGRALAAAHHLTFRDYPPMTCVKLEDEGTISYYPRASTMEIADDVWSSRRRQTMRLGRGIRRMIDVVKTVPYHDTWYADDWGIKKLPDATDQDVQIIVDRIAALMTPPTFRRVRGRDIVYWYNRANYVSESDTGNLYSCMSSSYNSVQIQKYADERNCSLAIGVNDDEKLVCRCLVWDATDGKTYFDKRYGSQRMSSLLVKWCEDQGWIDGEYGWERDIHFTVETEHNWNHHYERPYLDTMAVERSQGWLVCGDGVGGGFATVECDRCGAEYDDDEVLYHTDDGLLCPECHDEGYCTVCEEYIGRNHVSYVNGVGNVCRNHSEYWCADCGDTLGRYEREIGYCEVCEQDHRCPVCADWNDTGEVCDDCKERYTCVVCGEVTQQCERNERLYGVARCDMCQAECESEED